MCEKNGWYDGYVKEGMGNMMDICEWINGGCVNEWMSYMMDMWMDGIHYACSDGWRNLWKDEYVGRSVCICRCQWEYVLSGCLLFVTHLHIPSGCMVSLGTN